MFDVEIIKDYYDKGLFNDDDLQLFKDTGYLKDEDMISIINTTQNIG